MSDNVMHVDLLCAIQILMNVKTVILVNTRVSTTMALSPVNVELTTQRHLISHDA